MTDIPHFQIPFRFGGNSHALVNEQDTLDDVVDCVECILRTEQGERIELQEFGISDPTFLQGGMDKDVLLEQIRRWEPRVQPVIDEGWDFDAMIQYFRVQVRRDLQDD